MASRAKYIVVVSGRRWGKSEVMLLKLVSWIGEARAKGLEGVFWIILPTYGVARPIYRKLKRLLPPSWITREVGTDAKPDLIQCGGISVEFKSGEKPERLVAEGLLGAVLDEGGILKDQVWSESILPTLIDYDAPALIGGTPKGRNWFFRIWTRGRDPLDARVESYGGPSWENPFVPLSAIYDLANDMSQDTFRQEILAEFLANAGAVFRDVRSVVGAYSDKPTRVIGVDLAKLQDFTVMHGLDEDGRTTFFERFNQVSWPIQKARIVERQRQTGATLVIDSTGVGDAITDDLYTAGVSLIPFKFTNTAKAQIVEKLVVAIEQRRITIPDEEVIVNELEAFDYRYSRSSGRIHYSAPDGAHDDCVMSLALANWGLGKAVPDLGPLHY